MESKTMNCNRPKFTEWHETPLADPARKMCDAELVHWAMIQWEMERAAYEEAADHERARADERGCVVD